MKPQVCDVISRIEDHWYDPTIQVCASLQRRMLEWLGLSINSNTRVQSSMCNWSMKYKFWFWEYNIDVIPLAFQVCECRVNDGSQRDFATIGKCIQVWLIATTSEQSPEGGSVLSYEPCCDISDNGSRWQEEFDDCQVGYAHSQRISVWVPVHDIEGMTPGQCDVLCLWDKEVTVCIIEHLAPIPSVTCPMSPFAVRHPY
jgi:hypothetical protein